MKTFPIIKYSFGLTTYAIILTSNLILKLFIAKSQDKNKSYQKSQNIIFLRLFEKPEFIMINYNPLKNLFYDNNQKFLKFIKKILIKVNSKSKFSSSREC